MAQSKCENVLPFLRFDLKRRRKKFYLSLPFPTSLDISHKLIFMRRVVISFYKVRETLAISARAKNAELLLVSRLFSTFYG